MARAPLVLERLEALRDDWFAYRLKTPWRDGKTHVVEPTSISTGTQVGASPGGVDDGTPLRMLPID